ncbi:MAG TPA: helix-turn-helix domain-containing protein, partial [Chloroflexota bacterium]|nr:helix-turn-helix domain-containing protein [Chloroflexota bacterium]
MTAGRHDEARDYAFADRALALRRRAGLTQRDLAALLEVSEKSIQAWEAGLSYPGAERLKQLIAFYLERGAFVAGQEVEEAAALWATVLEKATRRTVPFDPTWFVSLRTAAVPVAPLPPMPAGDAQRRDHWGEAPEVAAFYGRDDALATLSRWLLVDRCRLVAVLGMGGVGKTLLAARFAREAASRFDVVCWRSLRNAPPVEEWLAAAIAALSPAQGLPPDGFAARLALLLELLQTRRGLLVLDNLETILEPGAPEARYREGYAGYGEVLRRLGEHLHQGCLLVTGREAPPELAPLAGERTPVRTLRLGGLGLEAGRALLQDKGLVGDDASWEALVAHYSGNPLALRIVGETIGAVFGGDIAAFLAQDADVFGGIRQLLDEHVGRLSTLERGIGSWLAVVREPVRFAELIADLGPRVTRGEAMEAVEGLRRRSLLEQGGHGTFTLQPVVLEYVTTLLVEALAREILAGEPALLVSHALLKAAAKDYVRHSQERLIAQPLLERLSGSLGNAAAVERRLLVVLSLWRGRSAEEQGYGPGNVVNLLRLLRGDLRGLDLSRLAIRHAYLQGVEAQDASLTGAHLSEVVLAEGFNYPTAVALSADGAYLVVGTSTGEVCLLRVADRTLLMAVQAHMGPVPGVATSGDGSLVVSGSYDGTVKLWEVPSGRLLATMHGHSSGVWCVALSADGHIVVSGGLDGTVKLWEAAPASGSPGRLLASLQGHDGGIWGVATSGDGRLVVSGSQDGTIKLWEAAPASGSSGRLLATLPGDTSGIRGVALSADGALVASGGLNGTVRLWETAGGQLLASLQGHTGGIWSVALSSDGALVISGSQDGAVRLWETESGRLLATLRGHTSVVYSVTLSGDGALAASGSQDGTVKLWETRSGRLR